MKNKIYLAFHSDQDLKKHKWIKIWIKGECSQRKDTKKKSKITSTPKTVREA